MLADAYVHRLSPWVLQFTDDFGIRWYGVSYVWGFLLAWLLMRWMAKTRRTPMSVDQVGDLVFWIIVGVLLGGRLGYAVLYDPSLIVGMSSSFPFWDLLAINKGGMASHGGMIGFILACAIYARKHGLIARHLFDIGAVSGSIGLFFGRIANFVNAELWGRAFPDQDNVPWWCVKYPEEVMTPGFAHLDVLRVKLAGTVTGGDGFAAAVVAAMRDGNEIVIEVVRPYLTAFYPSQLMQAVAGGPLCLAVLVAVWWRPRKPGVVGSWFLIAYGVLRIASEFVRQPDVGVSTLNVLGLELSRGQQLSTLMVLSGIVTLIVMSRWNCDRMPGLIRRGDPLPLPAAK